MGGQARRCQAPGSRGRLEGRRYSYGLAGGYIFKQATIERLFRDARLGRIHPANAFLTREFVAKTVLGISIDETPRWG